MKTLATIIVALLISGCAAHAAESMYTLYRTSVADASMRIHVATFDADEGENYNRDNCQTAARIFAAQPRVTVRYFCEKGRYRP
jgi:hypothetical protein